MGVTALANAIACSLPDNDDLALAGAVLTQLGDTLATIAARREVCAAKCGTAEPPGGGKGPGQSSSAAAP